MTGQYDDTTEALTHTLRQRAARAPSVDGLAEKAMVIVARRRRRRLGVSIAAIVVLVVGIPVAVMATLRGGGDPPAANHAGPAWRWESYRGAEVQVPSDWAYGVPGRAWCTAPPDEPAPVRPGAVGRPGAVNAILCPSEYPPADQRENWLTFDSTNREGERPVDGGWVEETRRVNGVYITVFTDDAPLRAAILASARSVTGADAHGCAPHHPVVADPDGYRPTTGGLPPGGAVESISVCRYALTSGTAPPLLSSGRVTDADAESVVEAIRSAPEGTGPDVEDAGPGDVGSDVVVLRVATVDGVREVVVRYSGGAGNGIDDGTTRHRLTADAIRPLLSGANSPEQLSSPIAELLYD